MITKLLLAASFLIAIPIVGCSRPAPASTADLEAPSLEPDPGLIVFPAERVASDFVADEQAAGLKYGRRFISVRGEICKSGWQSETPKLELRAGDHAVVSCDVGKDPLSKQGLQLGDEVIVRGWCHAELLTESKLPSLIMLSDAEVEQIPQGRKGWNVPVIRN